ncbi:MAG: hypothetical protein RLZZ400_826, partial [Actinomycetota bacterium]
EVDFAEVFWDLLSEVWFDHDLLLRLDAKECESAFQHGLNQAVKSCGSILD